MKHTHTGFFFHDVYIHFPGKYTMVRALLTLPSVVVSGMMETDVARKGGDRMFNEEEPLLTVSCFLGGREGKARLGISKEF